jgi:putative ABC transport system ATP-binding protein
MLRITDLHHTFNPGQVNEARALNGIDLYLPAEQFVTLIGSNGAGKSTLFNIVAGEFAPSRGSIVIDGIDVTAWPEHRRAAHIGRVFQNPLMGTAASMTIAQNLTLALLRSQSLRLRTGVTNQRKALFRDLLAPLDLRLDQRLDTPVSLLSGGQRQAMTLLMATLSQPKLLLLDEHTAALDPATAAKILDLTCKIVVQRRLTTLMITHNMQQALDFGDRLLMMDAGQIVLDLDSAGKAGMTVSGLVDQFKAVRHRNLVDDELLLE